MATTFQPPEILSVVCGIIFESALADRTPSLDPLLAEDAGIPTSDPSSYPPAAWSETTARHTLLSLTLVSRTWYHAARPFLWRYIPVRLPRTWLSFIEQVADGIEDHHATDSLVNASIQKVASDALATQHATGDPTALHQLKDSIFAKLSAHPTPYDSIPPELLTPPASRDPSPARLRARSPGRWRFMRALSDAVLTLDPDVYVSTPEDPRPGRYVRHLDFNHFRTIGMRRSVEEGVRSRFVTAERVLRVLKEMPRLAEFGATEYMDGALNKSVLTELLLRGPALPLSDSTGRGRGMQEQQVALPTFDDDEKEHLRECEGLEALDLCGCISSVFVQGLEELVREQLEDHIQADGSVIPSSVTLPTLKRLGLRGVTSLSAVTLTPLVLACTSLTHLDLSGTRCTPDLLASLADVSSVRLTALALARCPRLTSESITEFLIDGLPARSLTQLSLYGDLTFKTCITETDLARIVTEAPCFKSGALEYLDLSSSPMTPVILGSITTQSALRSLGLSFIPELPLSFISSFLKTVASNVEIITLVSTSPELDITLPNRRLPLALHSFIEPLTAMPFRFSSTPSDVPVAMPPTRLRVVELGVVALNSLGIGGGAWKIVRSKGGRGWYVHTTSGWENGRLRRDLPPGHPIRMEFEKLAASNGNVSSGVGWHARKMEVLQGRGMLGREDGLYGAVSFAYQG